VVRDAGTWRALRKAERYEDAGEDATANTRRFADTIDNTRRSEDATDKTGRLVDTADKTRRLEDARAPGGCTGQEGGWVGGGAWDGEVATSSNHTAGYQGIFDPGRKSVSLSVGILLCPYGNAYRRMTLSCAGPL